MSAHFPPTAPAPVVIPQPHAGRLLSALPFLLPKLRPYARGPILRRAYWKLVDLWDRSGPPAKTKIYGFPALLNRGNLLPFFTEIPLFNAPLVELAHQLALAHRRRINVVDVGAAVGDTVLLLQQRCPTTFDHFVCIDGDEDFYPLLCHNLRTFPNVTIIKAVLAASTCLVPSLVKHHQGTAACTGLELRTAIPLDTVPAVSEMRIDLLKVDVDGFDGDVLAGAKDTLRRCSPAVIFEWHPALIKNANRDPFLAFQVLIGCGYQRLLWFHNDGSFSHFSSLSDRDSIDHTLQYLLAISEETHAHFDIIAVPEVVSLDLVALAQLKFAQTRATAQS